MMGQQTQHESLFFYFRLEEQIPEDHLLRLIDHYIDLSFVRGRLKRFYSQTGRPSIDPEVLLRLLLVGYLYGITSERRLLQEVKMHLAYRWFTRLDFSQEIPDHSTFSKNRHGRFRQSGVFREVFEEIVRRCLAAGLVEGKNLAVDGTMVGANASRESRVPREQLKEAAQVSRTVREYLAELEQVNPVSKAAAVSTTDPDAIYATKGGGTAIMAYYDNYLIDPASRVILGVEATPALYHQEAVAARRMLERVEQLELSRGVWVRTRRTAVGSFWHGCSRAVSNLIFPSLIIATKPTGTSHSKIFATTLRRTSTTAQKGNLCATAAGAGTVEVTPIARLLRSAKAVHRRNGVLPGSIGRSSYMEKNPLAKRYGRWPGPQPTSIPGGLATKLKVSLPNSSSACAWVACDFAACGTYPSSSCWRPQLRT